MSPTTIPAPAFTAPRVAQVSGIRSARTPEVPDTADAGDPGSADTDPDDPGRGRPVPAPAAAREPERPRRPDTPATTPPSAGGGDTTSRLLLVPVRGTAAGVETIRLFKEPTGRRVAVAFTSIARLRGACGAGQRWIVLGERCLRETVAGLGVDTVVRDPHRTATSVTATSATASAACGREGATPPQWAGPLG